MITIDRILSKKSFYFNDFDKIVDKIVESCFIYFIKISNK